MAAVAACVALTMCAAAPVGAPEAAARKPLSLKQKKKRCLKAATRKGSARARRRAARRCRRRYRSRHPAARRPVPAPVRTLPVGPAPTVPALPPGAPLPRYVSVTAREFYLTLSRPLVGAGSVTVELRNYGEDPHDLVVSPEGRSQELARFGELGPGAIAARPVALARGRYRLWCSLEGHEQAGMRATLRVE